MTKKTFTAKLERFPGVGTWVYVTLPFDAARAFGAKGQIKVKGTLNGAEFRSSLMPHGDGRHFIVVNKAIRTAAKADVGATVTVAVEPDTAERVVAVPRDLQKALNAGKPAKAAFGRLPYSHQKEYVTWIESAKKAETRARRIAAAIEKIAGGERLKG